MVEVQLFGGYAKDAVRPRLAAIELLFVVFDDRCGPDVCRVGVVSEFPPCATLAQQVPALIQFDLQ